MSPSMNLYLAALCAVLAVQVSASRLLHSTARTGAVVAPARRLSACQTGCSNLLVSAASYGVLGASEVTNTGQTLVQGDLGVYPGSSASGFPPGRATGTIYTNALNNNDKAQADAKTANGNLTAMQPTAALTGQDLAGLTLLPGVYNFAGNAHLGPQMGQGLGTGNLTLDAGGNSSALFVFLIKSGFVTASGARVVLTGGAQACNVFFSVGSSAELGSASFLSGSILADQSIVVKHDITVAGTLVALNAAVTMDDDQVTAAGYCPYAPNSPDMPPFSYVGPGPMAPARR